ncbi:PREDICTED: TRAF3-interacting JNK-activating modulator [Elephantulus edwardii]|uniref:TRAF3-interacting JNK-activating modulator n=1 Tax=Elephantulus edwardii TaxID=28737 RepID=UPI0003F0DBF9|nr:PREDICTED: TRAF3-interacting JNK-activating modulator [Elephantulus edwardii]
MISPDPRPSPRLARRAESYEAKCERRLETREHLCCRRNVTTCRQVGKVLRSQQREQLKTARQQQFFRRRNLELEEKGKAESSRTREQGSSRRKDETSDFNEPSPQTSSASPGQQVAGSSSEIIPKQQHPPSVVQKVLADHLPSRAKDLSSHNGSIKKPLKHHCGTQTKAEKLHPANQKDASQQTSSGAAILDKEIIQLSEYLKEALQRELALKQKMVILQDLLSHLILASDNSWKGQLNEDKLKGKLNSLENQLYTCTQKYSPRGMKKLLLEMERQKTHYEQKAKESLQKVLEEKIAAEQQLQSTQRSLALAEQKCEEWRTQYNTLKEDWRTLGTQHRELESQFHELRFKLQGADSKDMQMNQALRLLENEHQELQAKIEHLQGDRDLSSSDLQDLHEQLKRSEEEKLTLVARVQELQSLLQNQSLQLQEWEKSLTKKGQALPVWSPQPSQHQVEPKGTGEEKDWDLQDQLRKKTLQFQAKEKECRELHAELDHLSDEYLFCQQKLQHCREELNRSRQPPPTKQCSQWLPMLIVVTVTALLAVFLANKNSLIM